MSLISQRAPCETRGQGNSKPRATRSKRDKQ